MAPSSPPSLPAEVGMADVPSVGGKCASLGEMFRSLSAAGVNVPDGFATTAEAYRAFLAHDGLAGRISEVLAKLDHTDTAALQATGKAIRSWIMAAPLPPGLAEEVAAAYRELSGGHGLEVSVAVRSSATAEDLPDASFAGQQDTLLNIRGPEALLSALRLVFASLFNDRAISYRVDKGFAHDAVALSVGVQRMARAVQPHPAARHLRSAAPVLSALRLRP